MAQRRRERNAQESEGGSDEASEEERTAAAGRDANVGGSCAVGGIGGVPCLPGERCKTGVGKGRARDDIRTVMEGMGLGRDDMDTGETAKADEEDAEAEGGGLGVGGLLALEVTCLLTQDAYPGGTTLADAFNGFNELIRLKMIWTVRHCWLAEARFMFNCYRN